jgi:hypothetical protein
MATLTNIRFKHGNFALQLWSEPHMSGVWKGVLTSHHTYAQEIANLAASLEFNDPYAFGASMWSIFKIHSREPLAIIDEVVQRMRRKLPDFRDMPDDLWFNVHGFSLAIGWEITQTKLCMCRVGQYKGQQTKLVTRLRALTEVKDATDLQDGTVVVIPQDAVGNAEAMLDIGQKLAEAYEKRNE